ncbi:FadR/GntR family transcriptional regulator [Papillibacter cinnamivorans]|uniref:GntR family transcriptional regulator, transcriptional repressor for pyruvate dehydrogenase complex n=1 Tax=Papillibacter cinnamivorans DSM 12816 TaxID=1122930 RepID=A0A1W2C0T7_9FIRM|nr:FadR/GntR family transcriptional regulator [Papillibacter cinnamivorans]SMC78522.1 GntR family transcriptional regulator, transcriptional repressor for pyruvate dehydrogenase complex [Papillibacter cinnamivorans DSM 12816]
MTTSEKAYEVVIDFIKKQISSGTLRLEDRLPPERELAEELGVSRNSVREALRVLDILGVVSSRQGAGNYVSSHFESSLVEMLSLMYLLQNIGYRDLTDFRYGLERQALTHAVGRATETQVREMEENIRAMEAAGEESLKAAYDKNIHYAIAKISGNVLINDTLQALSEVMDRYIVDVRGKILRRPGNQARLQDAHRRMVSAIRDGDLDSGLHALDDHFRCIYESLEE